MKRQMTLLAARLLTVAALFGFCTQAVAAEAVKEAYAVYIDGSQNDPNEKVLTLYYDSDRKNWNDELHSGGVYSLQGWTGTNLVDFIDSGNMKSELVRIVIDPSFAEWGGLSTAYQMFAELGNVMSIEGVGNLNMANVESTQEMFKGCATLTALDFTGFNTSNVKYMDEMFAGSGLSPMDLSSFDTRNVISMGSMFSGCSFSSIDLSSFNTSNVINMSNMFSDCGYLEEIDLTNFNMQSIQNLSYMFSGCSFLKTIYCEDTWACDPSTGMFNGCTRLRGTISYDDTKLDATYANPETGYFTSKLPRPYAVLGLRNVLTFYYDNQRNQRADEVFGDGQQVTVYDLLPYVNGTENVPSYYFNAENIARVLFDESYADCAQVTTSRMFDSCTNLTDIDGMANLNTQNVTDMSQMFSDCEHLKRIDELAKLDTRNVTNMSKMFFHCDALSIIDVTGFDTQNVTDMMGMFSECKSVETLDVRNFNTQNVTDMRWMFSGCTSLTTIYCDDTWTCDNSMAMFGGDSKLVGAISYQEIADDNTADFANPTTGYFTGRSAYAVLSTDGTALNFYYDNQRSQREGTTYSMIYGDRQPEWSNNIKITTVTIDESLRDFDGLTSTRDMFSNLGMETITGLEYLNTSKVINMNGMFGGNPYLKEVDVSTFNVQSVTNMDWMFAYCQELTTIYCDDTWTCGSSNAMFTHSTKLVGMIKQSESKIDVTYANPITGYFTGKNTTGSVIDVLLVGNVGTARVEYDAHDAEGNTLSSGWLGQDYSQFKYSHNVAKDESLVYLNVYPPTSGTWRVTRDGTDITSKFEKDDGADHSYLTLQASDLRTSTFVVTVEAAATSNGDVNGDGSITIADVTKLVNIILGKE